MEISPSHRAGLCGHLATIEFLRRTGLTIDMVPYRGTRRRDRPHGRLRAAVDRPELRASAGSQRLTKVRALGIATKARSVLAPDVPTMTEAGLPGFEFNSWYGVWAPKGTPADIATKVNQLVQDTMRDPAIVKRLTTTLSNRSLKASTTRRIHSERNRACRRSAEERELPARLI